MTSIYRSPLQLLFITAFVIFAVHLLVETVGRPEEFAWESLDSLLLVVLDVPILYLFAYRPLLMQINERIKLEEAAMRSEKRYRSMFEASPDAVVVLDMNFRITACNSQNLRLLRYDRVEDVIGTEAFENIVPEDRELAAAQLRQDIEEGKANDIEFTMQRRDGSRFPALGRASVILDATGKPEAIIAVARDISERKRMEEELLKLNRELEHKVEERTRQLVDAQEELVRSEKLAVVGKIAGIVGHEIRNPLGVMSNAVFYLTTVLESTNENVKEYLNIIKEEIASSERIVSDLIDFTRTRPPQKKVIPVEEVIKHSLSKYNLPENVVLEMDIPESLPDLDVDPAQMVQVFVNIIKNAAEVMQQGGTLSIKAMHQDTGLIKISFIDTGPGISSDVAQKLFQPLFTTKARGLGLGLSVVKNLAEANGGRVEVESEEGKGTTFTVVLPAGKS